MATKPPQTHRKRDRNPAQAMANKAFAELLRRHLYVEGTRPGGAEPRSWTAQEFADRIPGRKYEQKTAPRTVEYWLAGETIPEETTFSLILVALFGAPPTGGEARRELRFAYETARRTRDSLTLKNAPHNPAGEAAVADGDRIGFNRSPTLDDVQAAQDANVKAEHPGVLAVARELAAMVERYHNQLSDGFTDLRAAAERFVHAISCDTAELPTRLAASYQACVSLGSFHDLDQHYVKILSEEQALPPDLRTKLGLTMSLAAPLLHAFPYVQQRDRSLRTFLRLEQVEVSRSLVRQLEERDDLVPDAIARVLEMLATSQRPGAQGQKAQGHLIDTIKNILVFGGAGVLDAVGGLDPALRARLYSLFRECRPLIEQLADDLPPEVRAAVRHATDLASSPDSDDEKFSPLPHTAAEPDANKDGVPFQPPEDVIDPANPSDGSEGTAGLSQRLPPANLEAEQALLGALLANNKAYERVSEFLAAEHFADPVHARIFAAIQRRIEAGQLADAITLRAEFESNGLLAEVGGASYIVELVSAMVGVINAGEYGKVIHDAWLRRQLIDAGEQMVNLAFGANAALSAEQQLDAAEMRLFEFARDRLNRGGFASFERNLSSVLRATADAFSALDGVSGLPTGLQDLDQYTGGLYAPDLILLAGCPGIGKTALASRIAFGVARALLRRVPEDSPHAVQQGGVAFFSLQTKADQLTTLILAGETRIPVAKIRRGNLRQGDFDRLVEVSRELQSLPLYIDDTPSATVASLRSRCMRLQRARGLDLVIVDHLQLIGAIADKQLGSRMPDMSMLAQDLKAVARELAIPVIALLQITFPVIEREDKRPQLADLERFGTIEQDADMIMFFHRDDFHLARGRPQESSRYNTTGYADALGRWEREMENAQNKADLIIAKQQHGPPGTVRLFFEPECARFGNLATHYGEEGTR